jgi:UDP-glucose:(heptosyl)LPS alpha-1,3-glucosyltransferase
VIALIQTHLHRKGGLEKAGIGLIHAFERQGYCPTILTADPYASFGRCKVVSLPCGNKKGTALYRQFEKNVDDWLKDHPQKIVFGLDRTVNQTHYRAGNGSHKAYLEIRKKLEGWLADSLRKWRGLHRYYLDWEKRAFESPSLQTLFVNSHMVKEEILGGYHTKEDKICVVHNGVEWKALEPSFEESLFHIDTHPYHFLFAGNGYERKGLSYLLKGLALIKMPFVLSVVGYEKNLKSYQRLAKKLGILERVNFYGPRPSLLPFYQQADCLVIPSVYDPFANITVEALAMGLYVISSSHNGGKEVLTEENGTLISNLSLPHTIQQSLEKALSYPKTRKRAQMIRDSIRHLDFSSQLDKIVASALKLH